jgi:hypothetical protein
MTRQADDPNEPDDRAELIAQAAEDDNRTERYIGETGYVHPGDYRAAREFG